MPQKTALITGGSRGIGFEIAKLLINDGYRVAICSRNNKEVSKAVTTLGGNCIGIKTDVSNSKDIDFLVRKVIKEFDSIDILVNNAGVLVKGLVGELKDKQIEDQIRINLEGLIKVTNKFLPFIKEDGLIVNISSGAGKYASAKNSVYCSTKFGVRGFTQALAQELSGIKVYSVNPGYTATKMTNYHGVHPEKVAEVVLNTIKGKYKVKSGGDVDVWELV